MLNTLVYIIWLVTIPLIFICSIIFSFKLNFLQIKNFKNFKNCFKVDNKTKITPFQSFTMSLAGKVGVGSIAGIYIAIEVGGYGSIFWLWVSCILFSILGYAEGCLSQIYKEKTNVGMSGGAYYYIKKGLNLNKLSFFYAILIFITYSFIFTSIQVKTIAISFNNSFNLPHIYTGLAISAIIFTIIFTGTTGIAKFSEKLVPFMAIFYVFIGIYIIIYNYDTIPYILNKIITDAFNFSAIAPSIVTTILVGIRRGIFSTEIGVGTSAILSGSVNSKNPTNQGYIQVLSIYTTSLIICSITAFIVLIANVKSGVLLNVEGSLKYFLGSLGSYYLSISLFLFGLSTILSAYFFGESVLTFLIRKKTNLKINKFVFKILISAICIISSTISNSIVWNLADLFIGILTIINSISMLLLINDVVCVTKKETMKK